MARTGALIEMTPAELRWLIVVAAPAEATAVLQAFATSSSASGPLVPWTAHSINPRLALLLTGVGKANAAAGLARVYDPATHAGVLNLGVAGVLPGGDVPIGGSVLASESVYADEGSENPEGFVDIAALDFAPADEVPGLAKSVRAPGSPSILRALTPLANRVGPIATVSSCSGTDVRARETAKRTGAIAEAMEGAALAFTLARLSDGRALFAELRVISNTTGNRAEQTWRLTESLARISAIASLL